jgi:hypothetical protein
MSPFGWPTAIYPERPFAPVFVWFVDKFRSAKKQAGIACCTAGGYRHRHPQTRHS